MSFVAVQKLTRISAGILLLLTPAFGQFSSALEGTVQDPSGAGLPKAKLSLESDDTHVVKTATSDDAGKYEFVSLAPGSYRLSAQARALTTRRFMSRFRQART